MGATGNPKTTKIRITGDPKIGEGEAVFKGTRVTLRTVLVGLADGDSAEEILGDCPNLKADDIQAAVAFAAASAEEDLPVPEVPKFDNIRRTRIPSGRFSFLSLKTN